ncbi:MAG TPA: murein biosynthesis integral membrane protein MurJ [Chloroflexota bacterium]|nr:murein biosynthesis integral membrane protein MurJ [Chloroflexota bacterium]
MSSLQSGIFRAATIILLGNVLSRVVGFARDVAITTIFGASAQVSGYVTALKVQTSVYDLLVSGVISAAFIPVFSELRERRQEFSRVASSVLTATVVVMLVATILTEIFAAPLISLLGAGDRQVAAAAQPALRLMAPAILFLGVSGVLTALLYAKQRFIYPAFTPVIFNLAILLAAVTLHSPLAVKALVVGVLAGAIGQVVLQLNGLHGIRLRPQFDRFDPQVRRIGRLYLPVALGLIVTEAQVFLDLALQNSTGPHSVVWLNTATRVYQLPLGFVATAMSLASLPTLSLLSGHAFRETLTRGLKVVALLIVPAVVILGVLSTPIFTLAFRHGKFSTTDVASTVAGMQLYLPGLAFAALDQLLIFAFYARNDTKTPVLVGLLSIAGYGLAALLALTTLRLGYRGLALADSAKQIVHATVLFILLWRWQGSLAGFGLGRTAGKIGVAALVSALVCVAALHVGSGITHGLRLLVYVAVSCGAGLASYFLVLALLRTEELSIVLGRVRSRLGARGRLPVV